MTQDPGLLTQQGFQSQPGELSQLPGSFLLEGFQSQQVHDSAAHEESAGSAGERQASTVCLGLPTQAVPDPDDERQPVKGSVVLRG